MKGRIIVSTLLALLLLVSLPMSALAATWDIGNGDIIVNAGSGGQTVRQGGGAAVADNAPVITGTSTENNVTINAEKRPDRKRHTSEDVNIDMSDRGQGRRFHDRRGQCQHRAERRKQRAQEWSL